MYIYNYIIGFSSKFALVDYYIRVLCCFYCIIISTYNPHAWMLSLEIFGSVCAADADYRQIRYRPSIPAGASKDFINEYNNTSQFFTSTRKISCSEKSFHIFHFLYIFKTNGTELIYESADVCLHFSGHVTSQAFERVLSFCFNSRCMYSISFSPYTLGVSHSQPCADLF